jgi:hypothetical protein
VREGADTKIRQKDFGGLVEQGNNVMLKWPVAERHRITAGEVVPLTANARPTFPLLKADLFLSFAKLGQNGEPSEKRILDWVNQNGLLREKEIPSLETLETRVTHPTKETPEPVPITLQEFRTEARTAHQLITLYRDISARDGEAVMSRYVKPPAPWRNTPDSPVDRYLRDRLDAASKEYRVPLDQAGERRRADLAASPSGYVEARYLQDGLRVLMRCLNTRLWNIRPWMERNYWDAPPEVSVSLGLERWLVCPDLLSAMYLQFYLLVTDKKPMRICANPNCRMPFPAVPKHKKFCRGGCRSTGRNHPH